MAMVRGAFRLTNKPPQPTDSAPDGLTGFANRAWEGGLLAVSIEPPVQLPAPEELRPAQNARWSIAEIRRNIERGQPLVAMVNARLLPGHSSSEGIGDQPMVVIGKTPTGLVYSDPSFSSSLGYGLEIDDVAFLKAWQEASPPLRALAFRPRPSEHGTHQREIHPGMVFSPGLAPATPPPVVLAEP